jgi:hypothetical protein
MDIVIHSEDMYRLHIAINNPDTPGIPWDIFPITTTASASGRFLTMSALLGFNNS